MTRNKRRDKVGIEEEMKGLLVISISKFMGCCIQRHERHRFGRRLEYARISRLIHA
jgi:hypothetical protein